jgi:Ca2+-binding RTX toxin-like protein
MDVRPATGRLAAFLSLAALLALPAGARAATASASGDTLTVDAAADLAPVSITVAYSNGAPPTDPAGYGVIVSRGALAVGPGCEKRTLTGAACAGQFSVVHIVGGSGGGDYRVDDTGTNAHLSPLRHVLFNGGPGRDTLDTSCDTGTVRIQCRFDVNAALGAGDVDTFVGGPNADRVDGGPGPDSINGNGGNDVLRGGANDDSIDGGPGDDTLGGDDGNDGIKGGDGNDLIQGGPRDDFLEGELGDDRLLGEDGRDKLYGGSASPLNADGKDVLFGGPSADLLDGGTGDDRLDGGTEADTFVGGPGTDTADYSTRLPRDDVRVSLDGIANDGVAGEKDSVGARGFSLFGPPDMENVKTGPGDDVVIGSAAANDIVTGGGTDTVVSRDSPESNGHVNPDDRVICGAGADLVLADAKTDGVAFDCSSRRGEFSDRGSLFDLIGPGLRGGVASHLVRGAFVFVAYCVQVPCNHRADLKAGKQLIASVKLSGPRGSALLERVALTRHARALVAAAGKDGLPVSFRVRGSALRLIHRFALKP